MQTDRTFIIAEVGSTHDGSYGNAKCAIDVVAECGADAVKFQTHIAEAETLRNAPMPSYFKGEPRFEYFQRTSFSHDQWIELKAYAEEKGLSLLSSAFSVEAVEMLESIGMERYKIPSGEVTNLPYLERIAQTGKPIILSSGMSCWEELDDAVATITNYHKNLTILQCTTEYPCPPERLGLNVMLEMKDRYRLPVGLSDHSLSNAAALAATTLGASILEKHFTLSKRMYGSDARHSAEPDQFAELVSQVREIESIMSHPVDKSDDSQFAEFKEIFQKSVVSQLDIPEGAIITKEMVAIRKPGTGLAPKRLGEVIGSRALRFLSADTVITEADVSFSNNNP
ncbi:MAG: N-acetylneuraminate synthase family protein [SAR202 cluster bacterium]|nr:N-acetylneuraminate synthase family protein [SAR202 cluster bacterium]